MACTETEILTGINSGNEKAENKALTCIYEFYRNKMLAQLKSMNIGKDEAVDIFQESVLSLFYYLKKNQLNHALDGLLWTICRRNALKVLKSRSDTVTQEAGFSWVEQNNNPETEASIEITDIINQLQELIKNTGKQCEKLLRLRHKGWKFTEIAEQLGIKDGNVRMNHRRCHAKFLDLLKSNPKLREELRMLYPKFFELGL